MTRTSRVDRQPPPRSSERRAGSASTRCARTKTRRLEGGDVFVRGGFCVRSSATPIELRVRRAETALDP